jgi:hypothetical protein
MVYRRSFTSTHTNTRPACKWYLPNIRSPDRSEAVIIARHKAERMLSDGCLCRLHPRKDA